MPQISLERVFHNDDNKIIKIDENLNVLKNMLINENGSFVFKDNQKDRN